MSDSSATGAGAAAPPVFSTLLLAMAVGIGAGAGVVAFLTVEHQLKDFLWEGLPEFFGADEAPVWWPYLLLVGGAIGVWGALQLPGRGGHRPLDGLGFDIGPRQIGSVLIAAVISLSVGAVVGPEMPLMAVGSAIAASLAFRVDAPRREILMLAGATSALTMILGNPLVAGILVLEVLVLRGSPGGQKMMMTLLTVITAMGAGYMIQVGAGSWPGVGVSRLAVPGLPLYDRVMGIDLLLLVPVCVITGLLGVLVVVAGGRIQHAAQRRPLAVIVGAAVLIATSAVVFHLVTGESEAYVLFSGQEATKDVITLTSVSTLVAIMLAKTVAYALSVGSGFRGGLIFPAMFLGVVHATIASLLAPSANLSALAAAGIAAGVAALLRLPFSAVVLAVLLCSAAGSAVLPPAIFGAVIGVLLRVAADRRFAPQEAHLAQDDGAKPAAAPA